MRAVFVGAFVALAGAFVLVGPEPASALPAAAAINHSNAQINGDLVQVRRWYKKRHYHHHYYRRPYYAYRYRPYRYGYYRPYGYGYYRPYYRSYGYWRRPGVGVWIGW